MDKFLLVPFDAFVYHTIGLDGYIGCLVMIELQPLPKI